MKTYIMTRKIHAVPAKSVNGVPWMEGLPMPEATPEPYDASCGQLPVRIEDGYMYTLADEKRPWPQWMEKEEFEKICRLAEHTACQNAEGDTCGCGCGDGESYGPVMDMTFGEALEAVKHGARIAREGWNGKGMYVFLAHNVEFTTEADISEFYEAEEGVEVSDVLVMRTAQGTLQPGWLATQSDMLAEDWKIVE